MDRFAQLSDRRLLERPRRSAGQAWAIAQTETCAHVYLRLKKLENAFDESRSS